MKKRDFKLYEEGYEEMPFEATLVEYRRKIVIQSLLRYKHDRILEVGCGMDPLFKHFSEYVSMTVIEPCESFYENAIGLKNNDRIEIYNGLFEDVADQLQQHTFDFIIVSCLLHEIPDTHKFLSKIHEISNKETTIHINVPNANSFHRILAMEMGLIESVFEFSATNAKMQQSRVFNLESLTDLLRNQKFKAEDSGSYFIKPFTHHQMEQLINTGILTREILDGLFGMTKYYPDLGSEIFVNCTQNGNSGL